MSVIRVYMRKLRLWIEFYSSLFSELKDHSIFLFTNFRFCWFRFDSYLIFLIPYIALIWFQCLRVTEDCLVTLRWISMPALRYNTKYKNTYIHISKYNYNLAIYLLSLYKKKKKLLFIWICSFRNFTLLQAWTHKFRQFLAVSCAHRVTLNCLTPESQHMWNAYGVYGQIHMVMQHIRVVQICLW